MPLFDLSWDLSKLREDSPLVSLEEGCIEFEEKEFKYFTEFSWYRVQNFMINLFYNSLYYLYKPEDDENGLSTQLMIHLKANKDDKEDAFTILKNLAEIEDLSLLLFKLLNYEMEIFDYKEFKASEKKKGALIILERLNLSLENFDVLPAYKITYLVNFEERRNMMTMMDYSSSHSKSRRSKRSKKNSSEEDDDGDDEDED